MLGASVVGQARVAVASLAQPLGTTLPAAAALKLQLADEITTQSSGRGRQAGGGEAVDCAAAGEGSLSSLPSHLSSFIFFIFRSFFLRFKLDVVDIKLAISIRRRRHVRPPSSKRNGLLLMVEVAWRRAWLVSRGVGASSARGSQSYTFGCMGPLGDALISDLAARPLSKQRRTYQ